ncbi:uncharacterized protein LOC114525845 [Dendronephthya gigantea]|uniref:uncharacterized protein LOC114525845 n=1 Tax=Dendronephthya gigantea TaxID=151771 RepID=UPI00106DB5A6|nr:uncharacterized protein LOC114525845 [Dendronephthya gigantea]XP_028403092.1 uncharacterized protein LOC114525845 [Dendronephthya gigantea]XP_028403094.1 uncharacterized protein LOC114525845 [Dendronephthya gigantea]
MKVVIFFVWIICLAEAKIEQKECSHEGEREPSRKYSRNAGDDVKGPDISKIARTSTQITVFWNRILSPKIEKYKVCYGTTITEANDCSSEKVVDGNSDNAILDNLVSSTDYTMAVRASTTTDNSANYVYGDPGKPLTAKTSCETDGNCNSVTLRCGHCSCVCKVDSEQCKVGPEIYRTERTSSTLKVFWNHLDDSISGYIVGYLELKSSGPNDCSSDEVTEVAGEMNNAVLVGLKSYTEYSVAVKPLDDEGVPGEWGEAVTVRTSCKSNTECTHLSHAICLNGKCECDDGYLMDDDQCRKITCDDQPCGNIGICETDLQTGKFDCKCPDDSFGNGYHCYSTPCYSSPCQNGGSCKAKENAASGEPDYQCVCPIGFSGDNCEVMEIEYPCGRRIWNIPYCKDDGPITETCNDTPCQNNGICLPIHTGRYNYACECQPGFAGRTCEAEINEQCSGKGICRLKLNDAQQCLNVGCNCFMGYSGDQCSVKNTECNNDGDCRNGGTCSAEKKCDCALGFKGVFCDEREHNSYINFPRIHFAGRFQSEPSTPNNYADNFDTQDFPGKDQGWNPFGGATWRLLDTRITRVCYANEVCTSGEFHDPLINKNLEDGNLGASAKLVDLDVEFQSASEIYGWSMQVNNFFKADFKRVGFRYMWSKMKGGEPSMAKYGAIYQSVLTNVQFGTRSEESPITKYLKEYLNRSNKKELSIRFNVDMYDSFATSGNYTYARMVGSIGISGYNSPPFVNFGRMLRPNGNNPNFWVSPFVYDHQKGSLLLDLGNSLAITEDGNLVKSIGNLALAYTGSTEDTIKCPETWKPFGHIHFSDLEKYELTAGILKLDVLGADLSASRVILAKVDDKGDCSEVVLAEDKEGVFIHPLTNWVIRAVPEETVTAYLLMTVYGNYPSQDDSFEIMVSPSGTITKKEHGVFEFTKTTEDPNHERLFIDGKVCFFKYYLSGRNPPADGDVNSAITILVWDKFEVPTQPNWIRHVQPIFKQYANLYPVMKINFLDLSNYFDVVENKYAIIKTMSVDVEDPRYMPVTRDMSPGKVQMILKWLKDDPPRYGYSNLGVDMYTLKSLLQTALQLEHATIPPYFTGYLSIMKGYNTEVKSMLKDILIDEMHHMAQVSNILNAIDGNPNLFAPHFVASYPSYLPGGVHPDVKITVNKISKLQIRNVFMVLETPAKELEENGLIKAVDQIIKDKLFATTAATSTKPAACEDVLTLYNDAVRKNEDIRTNQNTIGGLYTIILIVMAKLECDGLLTFNGKKPQLEVRGERGKEVIKIHDFGTAVQAIKNIIEEGEGSSPCNPLDESTDLSHYYKFGSIANKRHIKTIEKDKKDKSTHPDNECTGPYADTFAYIGRVLPFSEDGVWPIVDNPMMSMYKEGSRAKNVAKLFSKAYWRLLKALQNVFDGKTFLFGDTVAIMKDLLMHGNRLVQTPIGENGDPEVGPNAGPVYPTEEPDP